MWFDNQSNLLNSAGEGTASRPEPDGTYFFFLKYRPYAVRSQEMWDKSDDFCDSLRWSLVISIQSRSDTSRLDTK